MIRSRRIRSLIVFFALFLAAIAFTPSAPTAHACTLPVGGLEVLTIADYVERAPMVLEGSVTEVSAPPGSFGGTQVAVIEVSAYYKGRGPEIIAVTNFGSRALCLQGIDVGGPHIFYVAVNSGAYYAFYATQSDAYIWRLTDDIRAEVISAAGQAPATPDPNEAHALAAYEAAYRPNATQTAMAVAASATQESSRPQITPEATNPPVGGDEGSRFVLVALLGVILVSMSGLGYWLRRRLRQNRL